MDVGSCSHLESFLLSSDRWMLTYSAVETTASCAADNSTGATYKKWDGRRSSQWRSETWTGDGWRWKLSKLQRRGKTLRGGDKREYGSGQLTLQHRQNSKQTVFQFCWNTCSVWQRAHRQRHTLALSKHVRQTRQTARKEQREAALSKKAVTLPLPWSSGKDARLCSHNMPTCTSAATTAAHHLGHLCV